jgi:diaminopimelate epimerase
MGRGPFEQDSLEAVALGRVFAERRAGLVKAILADPDLGAEQVGFVLGPVSEAAGFWRLEMMGGEFCGNAARSFGLFVARRTGLRGKHTVTIEISGVEGTLPVRVDTETGWAEAEMPKPRAFASLDYKGRSLPVCRFDGITHVIARGLAADRDTFFAIQSLAENTKTVDAGFNTDAVLHTDAAFRADAVPHADAELPLEALGVMFVDDKEFMTPVVFVYGANSLVFESSCGSGSAALAAWKSRDLADGEARYAINQRGGVIETTVVKRGGEIVSIAIGGTVTLRELKWEFAG